MIVSIQGLRHGDGGKAASSSGVAMLLVGNGCGKVVGRGKAESEI